MFRYIGNYLVHCRISGNLRFLSKYAEITPPDQEIPAEVLKAREADMPVEMDNPFMKEKPMCVLCKYNVKVDYKNIRLLSQFVSRFTGKVYGRHISGLCERQQKLVETEIIRAQSCGLMPYYFKDPHFFKDPPLFNPDKPFRSHKY